MVRVDHCTCVRWLVPCLVILAVVFLEEMDEARVQIQDRFSGGTAPSASARPTPPLPSRTPERGTPTDSRISVEQEQRKARVDEALALRRAAAFARRPSPPPWPPDPRPPPPLHPDPQTIRILESGDGLPDCIPDQDFLVHYPGAAKWHYDVCNVGFERRGFPFEDPFVPAQYVERGKILRELASLLRGRYIALHGDSIMSRVEETYSQLNSRTYANRTKNVKRTKEDTETFFKGLRQFGTNFELIRKLLPSRTRKQLKHKCLREGKANPDVVSAALDYRGNDHQHFHDMIALVGATDQLAPIPPPS